MNLIFVKFIITCINEFIFIQITGILMSTYINRNNKSVE